ncbi:MAG TPA: hypothetical protein VLV78_23470 [Thermoanaerobaculia bacterium]|nr:hypothetical protein [Thermoanaerobaculia bacterium]
MTALTALWLPILLSAVFVFIASSIIHMAPLWHQGDYPRLPNQDEVMAALRPLAIPPGDYLVPRPASRDEMKTPEFQEKMKQGPVMMMTVMPNGPMSMGRNFVLWFIYSVVVSFFSAYIASRALPSGANYLQVFRFIGAAAFLGYAVALWQLSIWFSRAWSATIKSTLDGLIYALLTAGTFGWLWPR